MPDGNTPLKIGLLTREFDITDLQVRKDNGVARMTFSASSETPVERWYGEEILSHEPGAVRLDRAKRGAMPYLFNHDTDLPIGMIDDARVENKRLIVDAHLFATVDAKNAEIMIDGGLHNVSVRYRTWVVEEDTKQNRFTATDWEPYEISLVTIPADHSVGIGRSQGGEEFDVRIIRTSSDVSTTAKPAATGVTTMPDGKDAAAGASAESQTRIEAVAQNAATQAAQNAAGQNGENAVEFEKQRRRAIETLCKANRLDDKMRDYWIRSGVSLDKVSDDILAILEERGRTNPQSVAKLDLTGRETQHFSLLRMIQATYDKDWTNAGFELECSREIAKRLGKVPSSTTFYVPFEIQKREVPVQQQRDLTAATAGAGGFLVETENVGFTEMVRNRSVVLRMGAARLSGLVGSVTIPRQSAAATAVWLANEASTITESQQTFVQLALTPKTVGAYTEISRQLTLQSSPAAEGIVTSDLAAVTALGVDLAVLNGSGAGGQPTGIINTAGIGAVTGTAIAYVGVLEFQSDVATANVMPQRGGYVTTPAVAVILMTRSRFANTDTPLWAGNVWNGQVSGFPGMSSNQVPGAGLLFGDWAEAILAEWGVLEVSVNPFANFQAAIIGVRAIYTIDVGVRRPFAFSFATTVT